MTTLVLLLCLSICLASTVDGTIYDHRHDDGVNDVTGKRLTSSVVREKRLAHLIKKIIKPLRTAVTPFLDKTKTILSKLPFNKVSRDKLSSTFNKYITKAARGSSSARAILKKSLPLLLDFGERGLNMAATITQLLHFLPPQGKVQEDIGKDDLLPLLTSLRQRSTGNSVTCSRWIVISGIFVFAARIIV